MADSSTKVSVLFVCLGNICRSTMAEGVFRSLTKSNPRIGEVDSAGTGAYHTLDPPDYRTLETLEKHGITDYEHGARQVRSDDFEQFDYVFAMDRYNLSDLQRLQRRAESKGKTTKAKVMMFGDFGGSKKGEEVVDPYYGADRGFEDVYQQVTRFSTNFLEEVVDKTSQK
ncbi:Low molecular weight phosphotyrosine protein phosphatase [Cladophialophora chaetospira]|uniref:Low molecular weight phosphotyrosine protein phosphatase n=1 Tax=Cladophialophora chaetospira TaxID=386627 RepID=A0AA39CD54_9EURO|nr:Low molecular weight phosphotyrosine protein phosphatase [Cladophialophora chaetospira]